MAEQSREYIVGRIRRLKQDPVTNANLIKKWERKLRNYEMSISKEQSDNGAE